MAADCNYTDGDLAWVLDAPTELILTTEREESTEILENKLDNTYCTNLTIPGHDKYTTVELTFCTICTGAFLDVSGWTAYTEGSDTVGFGRPVSSAGSSFCGVQGFNKMTLEVFAPLQNTSGFCAAYGDDQSYIMLALPLITDIAVTSPEFTREATWKFKITGKAYGNVNYGTGPFGDFPDTGGMASGDNEVYVAMPDGFTLPPASCTGVPLNIES
jgi:hypothetical protein